MLTPEQIKDCLNFLPFMDRDGDCHRISDKIVLARKAAKCCICFQDAPAGTHHRVETAVVDGEMRSARYCEICCAAMVESWVDNGKAIRARFAIGHRAAA